MTSPLIAGYVAGLHRKLPAGIANKASTGWPRPTSITSPAEPGSGKPRVPRWPSSAT